MKTFDTFIPPVNPEDFKKLYQPDATTKAEYDRIIGRVSARCVYIMIKFFEIQNCKLEWWDLDNEGGTEDSPGHFDPERYKDEITFVGEFEDFTRKWLNCPFSDSIPTKWIYEPFEDDLTRLFQEDQVAKAAHEENLRRDREQAKELKAQAVEHQKDIGKNKGKIIEGMRLKLSFDEYQALVAIKKKLTVEEIKSFFLS